MSTPRIRPKRSEIRTRKPPASLGSAKAMSTGAARLSNMPPKAPAGSNKRTSEQKTPRPGAREQQRRIGEIAIAEHGRLLRRLPMAAYLIVDDNCSELDIR